MMVKREGGEVWQRCPASAQRLLGDREYGTSVYTPTD